MVDIVKPNDTVVYIVELNDAMVDVKPNNAMVDVG